VPLAFPEYCVSSRRRSCYEANTEGESRVGRAIERRTDGHTTEAPAPASEAEVSNRPPATTPAEHRVPLTRVSPVRDDHTPGMTSAATPAHAPALVSTGPVVNQAPIAMLAQLAAPVRRGQALHRPLVFKRRRRPGKRRTEIEQIRDHILQWENALRATI